MNAFQFSAIIARVKPETWRRWRSRSRDGKAAQRAGPAGPAEQFKPQRDGSVLCREKLGGLIKECRREAA